jgi:hypothetical protein
MAVPFMEGACRFGDGVLERHEDELFRRALLVSRPKKCVPCGSY